VWGQEPVHQEGDMKATTIWPKIGASSPEFRGNQVHYDWLPPPTRASYAHRHRAMTRGVPRAMLRRVHCTQTRLYQRVTISVATVASSIGASSVAGSSLTCC
jgi:hypothetical protein